MIESGECIARSDCTYVQSDLDLHFSQNKGTVASVGIKVNTVDSYQGVRIVDVRRFATVRVRIKVRLYRARTQLLSSFAIQMKHELERQKPSTAFEAARLFLAVRDKIWSFGIMAQVESDTEDIIVMYLYAKQRKRKKRVSVLCYNTVHDSFQFQESWFLSCPLSCSFFSKLHKQSRLTLVPSFFLERLSVHVSICGNDAREVPTDWLIAKKPRDFLRKFALGAIKAVVRANKYLFRSLFEWFLYK